MWVKQILLFSRYPSRKHVSLLLSCIKVNVSTEEEMEKVDSYITIPLLEKYFLKYKLLNLIRKGKMGESAEKE